MHINWKLEKYEAVNHDFTAPEVSKPLQLYQQRNRQDQRNSQVNR